MIELPGSKLGLLLNHLHGGTSDRQQISSTGYEPLDLARWRNEAVLPRCLCRRNLQTHFIDPKNA